MITRKNFSRLGAAASVAVVTALVLTGCNGGAQNIDPAGNNPGASSNRTNPAQENELSCTVVPDDVLAVLTKNSNKGQVAVAWAEKAKNGWYVAGPVGDTTVYSDIRGLWATTGDIQADDFDSTFYSLNSDASKSTTFLSTAPARFSADSAAAKKALGCAKAAAKS